MGSLVEPFRRELHAHCYPDAELGLQDGLAGPDARYEMRESVELAFIVALQHLPASPRAVLILREVLGFSAKEVAATLDTTVASVTSALQRARASLEDKLPEQSRQATRRALGDEALREVVDAYVDAWRAQRRRRRRAAPGRGRLGRHAAAGQLVRAARPDGRVPAPVPAVGDVALEDVAFAVRSIEPDERQNYHRWVDQPADAARLASTFDRFALPGRLD